MRHKEDFGLIFVILASMLYGTLPMGIHMGHSIGLETEQIVIYRFLFSLPLILGTLWWKKKKILVKGTIEMMLVGGLGYGLTALLLSKAYALLGTAPATILHFTYPAVIMLFECKGKKQKLSRGELSSLTIVLFALLLMIEFPLTLDWGGILVAIFSAFTYAFYLFYLGQKKKVEMDGLIRTFWVVMGGTGFFLLRYGIFQPELFLIEGVQIPFLFCTAILQTLLPVLLLIWGLQKIRPSVAGIVGAIEPLTALILAAFFLGESLFSKRGIAAILIVVSVLIIGKMQSKEEKQIENITM